jgi:hypothetical protein
MVQIPSPQANLSSAVQEILLLTWNANIQCPADKSPLPDPVLSQMNPTHILTSYLSWIAMLVSG